MKLVKQLFIILALLASVFSTPLLAGDKDPLFLNLTTDESHRADMALTFSRFVGERGHPVTLFLNDKGVNLASKANSSKFSGQQEMLRGLLKSGVTVIVCPMCMAHYGMKESDLLEGIKQGNPDLTQGQLFKDDTKTLTW